MFICFRKIFYNNGETILLFPNDITSFQCFLKKIIQNGVFTNQEDFNLAPGEFIDSLMGNDIVIKDFVLMMEI